MLLISNSIIMRQVIWCALLIFLLAETTSAQTHRRKTVARKQQTVSKHHKTTQTETSSGYSITSSSGHSAYANKNVSANSSSQLRISDPVINALNARADGENVKVSSSGIIGIPKHNYGFADGHIVFHTSGAITSGTSTGSGAVGSGTSLGTFGSTGPGVEVNGKSPYAGAGMYGTARGIFRPTDSTVSIKRK